MARIRTIKPEFFDSPGTAACSPWARLLYIAMWCLADDWGIGPANMKELAAFAFPNDDQWTSKELPCLCKEVADNYGAVFFTHRGRSYYAIPTWDDHQVTQRKAKRRYPAPDDPESAPDKGIHDNQGTSLSMQGSSEPTQGKHGYGTGDQGNRGSGEKDSWSPPQNTHDEGGPSPESESDDLVRWAEQERERIRQRDQEKYGQFDDWYQRYPRKVAKGQAMKAYRAALKKTDHATLVAAIDQQAEQLMARGAEYCPHPATWLNGERWDDKPAPATAQHVVNGMNWGAAMERAKARDEQEPPF